MIDESAGQAGAELSIHSKAGVATCAFILALGGWRETDYCRKSGVEWQSMTLENSSLAPM